MHSFSQTLQAHDLELVRKTTDTLQVNLGRLCNQVCKHCHLEAGPDSKEVMQQTTVVQVADYAARCDFATVDITGGAPELNPHLRQLIELVRPHTTRLMLRCNLTALGDPSRAELMEFFVAMKVDLVASFPALGASQSDAQRGRGVFKTSLDTLGRLNALGYGRPGSGLMLDLVVNPTGAFLPPPQDQAQERFKREMARKWQLEFNQLYTFANVPLGRFKNWLVKSGNYKPYLDKLIQSFNSCAVDGLMCHSLLSVDWQGYLYDCDFNLAVGLPLAARATHITQMDGPPAPGLAIATGEHCYTCTAGSGFT